MTSDVILQSAPLIDLENDRLEPVGEIYFRITGKRLNPQQLWRWRVKGCRGVTISVVLLSGVWHTTSKAFAAFIDGQTRAANSACASDAAPRERDPVTERRLQAAGLLRQPPSAAEADDG